MSALDLPDDLVRLILEVSFVQPDTSRERQLELILLSRHVQTWLTPMFYRYITLPEEKQSDVILSKFLALPTDAHALTQCVSATYKIDALALLQACPNIKQLALWYWLPFDEPETTLLFNTRCDTLRRFSISLGHFLGRWSFASLRSPLFTTLTHLDFGISFRNRNGSALHLLGDMTGLQDLARLTHITFSLIPDTFTVLLDETLNVLMRYLPPNLEVLIVWFTTLEHELSMEWNFEDCDPRMVFCVEDAGGFSVPELNRLRDCDLVVELTKSDERGLADWGDPILKLERPDLWTMAEQAIERRSRRRSNRPKET